MRPHSNIGSITEPKSRMKFCVTCCRSSSSEISRSAASAWYATTRLPGWLSRSPVPSVKRSFSGGNNIEGASVSTNRLSSGIALNAPSRSSLPLIQKNSRKTKNRPQLREVFDSFRAARMNSKTGNDGRIARGQGLNPRPITLCGTVHYHPFNIHHPKC
jgi:hypothetical protein